jgi:hypothetical protein
VLSVPADKNPPAAAAAVEASEEEHGELERTPCTEIIDQVWYRWCAVVWMIVSFLLCIMLLLLLLLLFPPLYILSRNPLLYVVLPSYYHYKLL